MAALMAAAVVQTAVIMTRPLHTSAAPGIMPSSVRCVAVRCVAAEDLTTKSIPKWRAALNFPREPKLAAADAQASGIEPARVIGLRRFALALLGQLLAVLRRFLQLQARRLILWQGGRPDSVCATYNFYAPTRDNHRQVGGARSFGRYAAIRNQLDHDYHGTYTRARQALQDSWIEQTVARGVPQEYPWIIFSAGAMCSGKSRTVEWMSESGIFPLHNMVTIDPDVFR